jgi:hypothetical protein
MAKCANCGATLSCGCQKRTLPNGKSGCANCASKPVTQKETQPTKPTSPTVRPWGPDRYKHLQKFIKK